MNASAPSRVAVIGLGLMGGSIGANLVAAGHRVFGYDPAEAARSQARHCGIELLAQAADVPVDVDLVLTSLPCGQSLHATVDQLRHRLPVGGVVAELSTLSLPDKTNAREMLAGVGVELLDCPISGTGAQAVAGDLSIYASGDRDVWNGVAPIFPAFARRPLYVGSFGAGSRMKYIANLLVAIHNVATAEALSLAEAAGLDMELAINVLQQGAGNSRIFELRAPMMARRSYVPATMKLCVWQKDMDLITAFAKAQDVSTPLFDATRPIYDAARQNHSDDDTARVFEVFRSHASEH
ncbi:MAG TPA: NAD(P)-dependent oxidoreductase [Ramlibacter sp.]|nr:NAD(P)-dependent oxidoreductase [Ramlibacter sp.]